MYAVKSNLNTLGLESKDLLIQALESKLSLSIEERIDSHENARQLVIDLSKATKELIAGSQETS